MRTFVVLALGASVALAALAPQGAAQITGGFEPASVTAKPVVAAAKFAIEERSKTEAVTLVKVLKAESQVVAGTNYRLRLSVKEGEKTREAVAVVYVDLKGKRMLSSWDWADEKDALK
jgi:hypothetical protein